MVYRKSEQTPAKIRRDYPHYVEIEIPGSGLRGRLQEIQDWCEQHAGRGNYATTQRHDRPAIRSWLQVRFKDERLAEAFRKAFSGE